MKFAKASIMTLALMIFTSPIFAKDLASNHVAYQQVCLAVQQIQAVLNTAENAETEVFARNLCYQFGKLEGTLLSFPVGTAPSTVSAPIGQLKGHIAFTKEGCGNAENLFRPFQRNSRGMEWSIELSKSTSLLHRAVFGSSFLVGSTVPCN